MALLLYPVRITLVPSAHERRDSSSDNLPQFAKQRIHPERFGFVGLPSSFISSARYLREVFNTFFVRRHSERIERKVCKVLAVD